MDLSRGPSKAVMSASRIEEQKSKSRWPHEGQLPFHEKCSCPFRGWDQLTRQATHE